MACVRSRLVIGMLFSISAVSGARGQLPTPDPARARLVVDDIRRFVEVVDRLAAGGDSLALLQAEYFDSGTPGLRAYSRRKGLTAERMLELLRRHPDDYAQLGELPDRLLSDGPAIREAFGALKRLIPRAAFPPVYFFVGLWRAGGEASGAGLLISVIEPRNLVPLVTHEAVHYQQALAQGLEQYQSIYGPQKSLLALAIREGTADFIADLASGGHTSEGALAYVLAHEAELWQRFATEMHGADTGEWMWVRPEDAEQPQDVGYAIGYRIVQSFYDRSDDKAAAIQTILAVTDYEALLRSSGYPSR